MSDSEWNGRVPEARPHRISIRDVAERAGVAVSSVSRALSSHPDVSPAMRAKVLAAVRDCGYEPDVLARSLRSGASMSVGVIVGDISNPLIAHITLGVETVLAEAGFTSLLAILRSSPDREAELVRLFRQRRVDGLLVSATDESHVAMREELTRFGRPCIFLDRTVEELPRASSVLFDHRTGFREAAEHLIRLGHRKLAFIGGSDRVDNP